MNRRKFVAGAGAATLSWGAKAQISVKPAPSPASGGNPPAIGVAPNLAAGLNRLSAEWDRKRAEIQTPSGIAERNRFVRQKIVEMIGGFPERNPLAAVTVRVTERPGYRIENVMFQSRPNFWVTGNLYLPAPRAGRVPAIISPCGHYPLARMLPQYQLAYLNLVQNGFAVLAYDPIGQGERQQYWNPETNITEIGGPTDEHSMPGQLLFLLGESLTSYLIWDGMRAIDYLLSRPEVDPERIGCAGHSGGGTLTLFISAVDERVKCAVVHEGGTANRWPLRLETNTPLGLMDVEQNLFPAAIYGIDNADVHIAIAPRPLLATIERHGPEFDASAAKILDRYRQLGVEDKFATVASEEPHAWTLKLRQATTDWFSRWFYNRPGPASEPELHVELPETLYCTPNGSVRYSRQGDTIWSVILKRQAKLPPTMLMPAGTKDLQTFREDTTSRIRDLLRIEKIDAPLDPRHMGDLSRRGYHIEKVEFVSEPGISIPTWVFVPDKRLSGASTILYFNEAGKDVDGMEFEGAEASGLRPSLLSQLVKSGHLVVAADVRGIGEARPSNRSPSTRTGEFRHLFDTETALSYMAWYMDRSLFGMRVRDVLRTVDYAWSRGDANRRGIRMVGKDMGALWVLYAAALDPRIEAVVSHGGLLSYRSLTRTDRYLHGADILVPHVLEHFDLPHVAAAISDRQVSLLSPVDAMKRPVDLSSVRETYRLTQGVYAAAGARGRFRIAAFNPDEDLAAQYLHLFGVEPAQA